MTNRDDKTQIFLEITPRCSNGQQTTWRVSFIYFIMRLTTVSFVMAILFMLVQ